MESVEQRLDSILSERIMVLDGAMGTMVMEAGLSEEDFRGELFKGHDVALKGNNDILCLTRPDLIYDIHLRYLKAGAHIIETCSFNSQSVQQEDYHTAHLVRDMNLAAAALARKAVEKMQELDPLEPRFVAGSVGPTGKTCSIASDMENPAMRNITFDELCKSYSEQMEALLEGGVDLLLIETIFDTLNAKAALEAARLAFLKTGRRVPIMLSVTVADALGHTLSGQTLDAFMATMAHYKPFSMGLNCSFGARDMHKFLKTVAQRAGHWVSAYPNAGLPNAMGCYDETPESMAEAIKEFASEGLVNIVGGCCGSTPAHIKAVAEAVREGIKLRVPEKDRNSAWLVGLETFNPRPGIFINVGERCNVAGSRKFLRLIKEKSYDEALSLARSQVRAGAMILDINMDDSMLDTESEMVNFLNLLASDPETAALPWMIDSSRFSVIEAALKAVQGKALVNSISLKEGERQFLAHAARIQELGGAVVVMAFDEKGQATTYERKIEICARAYRLLTQKLGFDPNDVVFDPNVLTIATGMREHDSYALDFIRATEWIHKNLPHARVSGGISNLSFSFRGNNFIREAMHAVFLYHAIKAGLDMAIVNPSQKVLYDDIPKKLLSALEDAVLNRCEGAAERLVEVAEEYKTSQAGQECAAATHPSTGAAVSGLSKENAHSRKSLSAGERLGADLMKGESEFLEQDILEALEIHGTPQSVIEGPLMSGMERVGQLFGEGKLFLPQVVKSARTMKQAVDILMPYMRSSVENRVAKRGKYLIATVKGDVHDIGKNIVSVVMGCNNFEVLDLGVMTPEEKIVETAISESVDFVALSGLITPSLDEMCSVARALQREGLKVPLFIGGATTTALHTAVKIAPLYDGPVFYTKDAACNPILASQLLSPERERVVACNRHEQERLRRSVGESVTVKCTPGEALERRFKVDWEKEKLVRPAFVGQKSFTDISISSVREYINWIHFYNLWGVRKGTPEAKSIRAEAEALLDTLEKVDCLQARVAFHGAYGTTDSIVAGDVRIPTPRQNTKREPALSLCDFVAPEGYGDHVGLFAVTVGGSFVRRLEELKQKGNQFESLLLQSVGDRLVEAASEWLHARVRRELWGYAKEENLSPAELFKGAYGGIRPAVGYPSLPDQRAIFLLQKLVDFESMGITLTENGAMYPQSSVCGLYISNRHARYFVLNPGD